MAIPGRAGSRGARCSPNRPSARVLLLWIASLAACARPLGEPDVHKFARQFAKASVDWAQHCAPVASHLRMAREQELAESLTVALTSGLSSGAFRWGTSDLSGCVASQAARRCSDKPSSLTNACREAVAGTLPVGESCRSTFECQSDSVCGEQGRCVTPTLDAGVRCTLDEECLGDLLCKPALVCYPPQQDGPADVCATNKAVFLRRCADEFWCFVPMLGVPGGPPIGHGCITRSPVGSECHHPDACTLGLTCAGVAVNTWYSVRVVTPGTCRPGSDEGGECAVIPDGGLFIIEPWGEVVHATEFEPGCLPDLFCDAGVCQRP